MKSTWERALERWTSAALIDPEAAERIRQWEAANEPRARWSWSLILGTTFGAILFGAGVVLLVGTQWERLSTVTQTALTVLLVSVFHVAGGIVSRRTPWLATVLHGIGTVAVGAGVVLIADIYRVGGHWSGAMLIWTIGAAVGWVLLRDWVQLGILAIVAPLWLISEWDQTVRFVRVWPVLTVPATGTYLLALTYLGARRTEEDTANRQVLAWIGGIGLIPAAVVLATSGWRSGSWLGAAWQTAGWTIAVLGPLAVAWVLRRDDFAPNLVAAAGAVLIALSTLEPRTPLPYLACALNACGLVMWGVREKRPERINLGVAGFALTVAAFFFSDVLDKLGRAAGLMALGLLFVGGGWYLERIRRRLVREVKT